MNVTTGNTHLRKAVTYQVAVFSLCEQKEERDSGQEDWFAVFSSSLEFGSSEENHSYYGFGGDSGYNYSRFSFNIEEVICAGKSWPSHFSLYLRLCLLSEKSIASDLIIHVCLYLKHYSSFVSLSLSGGFIGNVCLRQCNQYLEMNISFFLSYASFVLVIFSSL